MITDEIVEVRLVQAGRPTGIYEAKENGDLILKEIAFPDISLPFDLAVLPNTLTENGENLTMILIDEISHPPQTRVAARLLGGVKSNGTDPYLLGIPVADRYYAGIRQLTDLPSSFREELIHYLDDSQESRSLQWLDCETALSLVRKSVAYARQINLESERETSAMPSWRPIDRGGRVISYTEVEHYTDAEYTYFQLPHRFQRYMDQHLADDERILFALSRPAMQSRLQGSWLKRKKLQEGVLILTDQRLIQLVELMPPDSSGVRYGFDAKMGILERLGAASIANFDNDSVFLRTTWRGAGGVENLEWEFPNYSLSALKELLSLLSNFVPEVHNPQALRRAASPPVPEELPWLRDPAVNDPAEIEPILARFTTRLPSWLDPDEQFLYWALLPAWFDKKGYARVLLITDRRSRLMPDPQQGSDPEIELFHTQISSLDYRGSILSSHIGLSFFVSGKSNTKYLDFPYPAEHAFDTCFETLRRCVAVAPV